MSISIAKGAPTMWDTLKNEFSFSCQPTNYLIQVWFNTALQAAVWGDAQNEKVVQLLLGANADPNDSMGGQGTVLQVAAFWGEEIIVKHLLEANADVDLHCEGAIDDVGSLRNEFVSAVSRLTI